MLSLLNITQQPVFVVLAVEPAWLTPNPCPDLGRHVCASMVPGFLLNRSLWTPAPLQQHVQVELRSVPIFRSICDGSWWILMRFQALIQHPSFSRTSKQCRLSSMPLETWAPDLSYRTIHNHFLFFTLFSPAAPPFLCGAG